MNRAILVSILAAVALASLCYAGGKAPFIYAPPPDLMKLRQQQGSKGSGVFIVHVDTSTGAVTAVEVQKSTGSAALDEISIETLRKWRAKPHATAAKVRVPMSYTGRYPPR
jgi:TonB family protein